ncbi:MAG: hypothetical protein IIW99_03090 [Treponema sp.]|nr:hypothetical protein [Treponema sp.]MBR0545189.1 hypothetical protein [Treponema sp.]
MKSLLSKDEKTKLLEALRSSRQTQAAFAEINGINPKTLARWIYQQRLEARQNQNNVEFVELKRTVVKIRQEIIIRKAGIEIEIPSFDASSLKGVHFAQEKLLPWNIEITPFQARTGICVISNAFILKAKLPEVKITVDASCCACVTPESHKTALSAMKLCQINVTEE